MWEVQAKTGKSLQELCAPFDSVSLCMSKGLGAPIGSILVGTKQFIEKARWFRKLFGGAVRQSGGLAAAADYALTRTLPLMSKTHALTAHLASSLQRLGVKLLMPSDTNMVWIDTQSLGFSTAELTQRGLDLGNGKKRMVLGGPRLVLHFQISKEAVDDLIELVGTMKEEYAHTMQQPDNVDDLKKALDGKSMISKTGENGVAYSGN